MGILTGNKAFYSQLFTDDELIMAQDKEVCGLVLKYWRNYILYCSTLYLVLKIVAICQSSQQLLIEPKV
jgi:hypothetical protein